MLSRKYYKMVAENIRRQIEICKERKYDTSQIVMLTHELAIDFLRDNYNFKKEKFFQACGIDELK